MRQIVACLLILELDGEGTIATFPQRLCQVAATRIDFKEKQLVVWCCLGVGMRGLRKELDYLVKPRIETRQTTAKWCMVQ